MVFATKDEVTCGGCSRQINEGDKAHRIDGVVLHDYCRKPDPRFLVTTRKVAVV